MMTVLYWLAIIGLGSIRFDTGLLWVSSRIQAVNARLDRPDQRVYRSNAPFWWAFGKALEFTKGYFALWVGFYLYGYTLWPILATVLLLILTCWSPLYRFQNQRTLAYTILGIYTAVNPWLALICPVLFWLFTLLISNIALGLLVTMISLFGVWWLMGLMDLFLLLNLALIAVSAVAYFEDIERLIDGRPDRLLDAFNRRK